MNREEIREWLENWLADHLGVSPDDIEADRSLASYRLEADDLANLTRAIEEAFEESVDDETVRPRSTVSSLTRYLCELTGADDEDGEAAEEASREVDMDELARDIGLQ